MRLGCTVRPGRRDRGGVTGRTPGSWPGRGGRAEGPGDPGRPAPARTETQLPASSWVSVTERGQGALRPAGDPGRETRPRASSCPRAQSSGLSVRVPRPHDSTRSQTQTRRTLFARAGVASGRVMRSREFALPPAHVPTISTATCGQSDAGQRHGASCVCRQGLPRSRWVPGTRPQAVCPGTLLPAPAAHTTRGPLCQPPQ